MLIYLKNILNKLTITSIIFKIKPKSFLKKQLKKMEASSLNTASNNEIKNSNDNEFVVSINELKKSRDKSNIYILKNIAEEKFPKLKDLNLLNQCSSSANEKFQKFFDKVSLSTSSVTIFYSPKKEIKSFDELIEFKPFSNNKLSKIIMISFNELIQENISTDLIINTFKNLKEIKNNQELNFENEIKRMTILIIIMIKIMIKCQFLLYLWMEMQINSQI